MKGKTERYVLSTPTSEYILDGTFRPQQLAPTGRTPQLIRAYGYRTLYDLHDGLADATLITLTGRVERDSEDELALALRELRTAVRTCTTLSRNDRPGVSIRSGILVATPAGDDSNVADVTITFIPVEVPDLAATGIYDW